MDILWDHTAQLEDLGNACLGSVVFKEHAFMVAANVSEALVERDVNGVIFREF